jgi:hypothetical protein
MQAGGTGLLDPTCGTCEEPHAGSYGRTLRGSFVMICKLGANIVS